MFPATDQEILALLNAKGAHVGTKEPPALPEADLHVMLHPPDKQFSLVGPEQTRVYAVTTNYSYYPLSIDIRFQQVGDVVEFAGAELQSAKVPPVARNCEPGVSSRFVGLKARVSAARGDVGAQWSLPRGGKLVIVDVFVPVETV